MKDGFESDEASKDPIPAATDPKSQIDRQVIYSECFPADQPRGQQQHPPTSIPQAIKENPQPSAWNNKKAQGLTSGKESTQVQDRGIGFSPYKDIKKKKQAKYK